MKQMIEIVDVLGREILDSRGNPTYSAQICASVPKVWHSDKGVGINAFFPHPRNVLRRG